MKKSLGGLSRYSPGNDWWRESLGVNISTHKVLISNTVYQEINFRAGFVVLTSSL